MSPDLDYDDPRFFDKLLEEYAKKKYGSENGG